MRFKNLQIYRLAQAWDMDVERLDQALASRAFQPCGAMDMESLGWQSPFGKEALVRAVGGHWLLCLCHEQKILPAAVINQVSQERAAEIEEREGYRPGRKQMRELKERVCDELLPTALSKRHSTYVWIDIQGGWLVVDASSPAKADSVLEQLRKCVTDLPLRLLKTQQWPSNAMGQWLELNESPAGFTVDKDCELRADESNAFVRYVNHALDTDEVLKHLSDGMHPTRLAMTWNDRVSLVLTERLEVKKLSFLDVVKEQALDTTSEEEQFDSDFSLMALELSRMLPDLVAALGGEKNLGGQRE